jgi:hypothetical protein
MKVNKIKKKGLAFLALPIILPFFDILQHSCDKLVRIVCNGLHHGARIL